MSSRGSRTRRWHRSWSAVALLALAACGGQVETPAATAFAKDVLVDAEWVRANAADPSVRILEVGGSDGAYAEGHVPGAGFLPMGLLSDPGAPIQSQIATAEQLSGALSALGVRRDQTVVLYDRASNRLAARAYWVLKYYQHDDVRILNGGAARWAAAGGEASTAMTEREPSEYAAGPADPEIRTTWQFVVDHVDDPSTLMCDARSPDEHLGRDVRAARGGHIPGSINVEWSAAVNPDGTFRSAAELSQLYARAGFTPDKQIITYCQSGVRGAHTWFVLRELLGYPDVRNYDGSWLEYGNNPDSPIES